MWSGKNDNNSLKKNSIADETLPPWNVQEVSDFIVTYANHQSSEELLDVSSLKTGIDIN